MSNFIYKDLNWSSSKEAKTLGLPVPEKKGVCDCISYDLITSKNSIEVQLTSLPTYDKDNRYIIEWKSLENTNIWNKQTEVFINNFTNNKFSTTIINLANSTNYEIRILNYCKNYDGTEKLLSLDKCSSKIIKTQVSTCPTLQNRLGDLITYELNQQANEYYINLLTIRPDNWFGINKIEMILNNQTPIILDIPANQNGDFKTDKLKSYSLKYNESFNLKLKSDCGNNLFGIQTEFNSPIINQPDIDLTKPECKLYTIQSFELVNLSNNLAQFKLVTNPGLLFLSYKYKYKINLVDIDGNLLNPNQNYTSLTENNKNIQIDLSNYNINKIKDFNLLFNVECLFDTRSINEYNASITNENFILNEIQCPNVLFKDINYKQKENGLFDIIIKWDFDNLDGISLINYFKIVYFINDLRNGKEVNPNDREFILIDQPKQINFKSFIEWKCENTNIQSTGYREINTPDLSICPDLKIDVLGIPNDISKVPPSPLPISIWIKNILSGNINQLRLIIKSNDKILIQKDYFNNELTNEIEYKWNDFNPHTSYQFIAQGFLFNNIETTECNPIQFIHNPIIQYKCLSKVNSLKVDNLENDKINISWESDINPNDVFYGFRINIQPEPFSNIIYPIYIRDKSIRNYQITGLDKTLNYGITLSSICAQIQNGTPVLVNGDYIPGTEGSTQTTQFKGSENPIICNGIKDFTLESESNLIIVNANIEQNYKKILLQWRTETTNTWNEKLVSSFPQEINNLSPTTTYIIRIITTCSDNSEFISNPQTIITSYTNCSNTPSGIVIKNTSQTSIEVNWNPISNTPPNDTLGYIIKWKKITDTNYTNEQYIEGFNSNRAIITGLESGINYDIQITTKCRLSNSTPQTNQQNTSSCLPPSITYNTGVNNINLNWDSIANSTSYIVEWREKGSQSFNSNNINTNSFNLNGLKAGTEYEIRVITKCPSGDNSIPSEIITIKTNDCSIDGQNLRLKEKGFNYIILEWNGLNLYDDNNYFILEWKISGNNTWNRQTNIRGNNYKLNGLTTNTNYEFRLIRFCSGSESTPSPIFTEGTNVCNPIEGLNSRIEGNSIIINWNAISNGFYTIKWFKDGNLLGTQSRLTQNQFIITDIEYNNTYNIEVQNDCGGGILSQISNTSINLQCNNTSVPNIESISPNGILINWIDQVINYNNSNYYLLLYKKLNENTFNQIRVQSPPPYLFNQFELGTTYQFSLVRVCSGVNSQPSNTTNYTTLTCNPPSGITIQEVKDTSIIFNMGSNLNIKLIYNEIGSNQKSEVMITSTNYELTGLGIGKNYNFDFYNNCGNGFISTLSQNLTAKTGTCNEPGNFVSILQTGNEIMVTTERITPSPIFIFEVYDKSNGLLVDKKEGTNRQQTLVVPTLNKNYEFRVYIKCANGLISNPKIQDKFIWDCFPPLVSINGNRDNLPSYNINYFVNITQNPSNQPVSEIRDLWLIRKKDGSRQDLIIDNQNLINGNNGGLPYPIINNNLYNKDDLYTFFINTECSSTTQPVQTSKDFYFFTCFRPLVNQSQNFTGNNGNIIIEVTENLPDYYYTLSYSLKPVYKVYYKQNTNINTNSIEFKTSKENQMDSLDGWTFFSNINLARNTTQQININGLQRNSYYEILIVSDCYGREDILEYQWVYITAKSGN